MFLDVILEKIEEVTGFRPCVAGGNINSPIEYRLSQPGDNWYRLELIISFNDISKILSTNEQIDGAINNFYDTPRLSIGSICRNGGGLSTIGTKISYLSIYDVYPYEVANVPIVPTGTLDIAVNGDYDVTHYETAHVHTEGGYPEPTGTITIEENGTHNVKDYEFAEVDVPQPSGSITLSSNGEHDVNDYSTAIVAVPEPSGTKSITENGEYDITEYELVDVNVPLPELGDAATADVVAGKYFSSDTAGIKRNGSLSDKRGASLDFGSINISDGKVVVRPSASSGDMVVNNTTFLTKNALILGDATPDKVLENVLFSSKEGIMQMGTLKSTTPTLTKENLLKGATIFSNWMTDVSDEKLLEMLQVNSPIVAYSMIDNAYGGVCLQIDVSSLRGHTLEWGVYAFNCHNGVPNYVLFGMGYNAGNWAYAFTLENSGSGQQETQCSEDQPLYCFRWTVPADADTFQMTLGYAFWSLVTGKYKYTVPYVCDLDA